LIAALDKKIAKKRLIKQGAMQQLLTGKKRLPGFTDSWVEKKLGEILDYEQPQPYLVVSTDYVDSGIPVLTAGKSRILGYTTEQFGIYNKLPVIIFDDFTTDSKYISYPFKVKSSAMKVLSLKNNDYDLRLVYELMQQIDFPLKDHQRYWISEYSQLTISIPKDREEQTAIATILTDMDKEIADLEAKRDKYSLLKSGMMQKLLTGQIRLKINRI
jgi:type I restriction enzyme S subunit